jgi:hypothetical protein
MQANAFAVVKEPVKISCSIQCLAGEFIRSGKYTFLLKVELETM